MQEGGQPCVIHTECLMLSFAIGGGKKIVAIGTGADPVFLRKVRVDWLLETRGVVEREFLLLKQARVDVQTGLLNLSNLYYLLDTHGSTKGFQLVLMELPSRNSSLQYGLRHAKKCASALLNFLQDDSVLHYLGQCTFALVLQNSSMDKACFWVLAATFRSDARCVRKRSTSRAPISSGCRPRWNSTNRFTQST